MQLVLARTMASATARRVTIPAARGTRVCVAPAVKRPQQQSQHSNVSGDLNSFLRISSTLRLTGDLHIGTHTLCRPGAYVLATHFDGARFASGAAQRKAKEAEQKSTEVVICLRAVAMSVLRELCAREQGMY